MKPLIKELENLELQVQEVYKQMNKVLVELNTEISRLKYELIRKEK